MSDTLPLPEKSPDFVDRRRVLRGMATASLAAVAAGLASCAPKSPTAPVNNSTANNGGTTTTGGGGTGGGSGGLVVTVANFPALASVGGVADVGTLGSTPVALTRTGSGTYLALSRVCTHQGCTVDVVGNAFNCPCHGSQFNAQGTVTQGPAGQPLPTLTATVAGDGATVTIT